MKKLLSNTLKKLLLYQLELKILLIIDSINLFDICILKESIVCISIMHSRWQ